MMAWTVRTAGFFGLMAVWALVFSPGGDTAAGSDQLSSTSQELTVEVLSPTLEPDGIWRSEPDHTSAGAGAEDHDPLLPFPVLAAALAVAGPAGALGRRRRSRGRPLLAYPTARLRRGPPPVTFV
ncbi:MAG: hypothetical protein ACR2K0_06655 [Acidimicrobiales bacterium]